MKFREWIDESKVTIKANIRNKINKELSNLTSPNNKTQYFNRIPLKDISDILKKYGVIMLQEDNTEWSGFLTGASVTTNFTLAPIDSKSGEFYTPYTNTSLALQWHKMPSGKYEINCYMG